MPFLSSLIRSLTLLVLVCVVPLAAAATAVYPNSGPLTDSAYVVVIVGTGFTGTTQVALGGKNAASFTIDSDTQVTATFDFTSAMTIGPKSIVFTGGTGGTLSDVFTVTTNLSPTVVVNITAQIQSVIALCWTALTTADKSTYKVEGDTTAVTWALGTLTTGAVRDTDEVTATLPLAATAPDFQVRNVGSSNLTLTSTVATTGAWTIVTPANRDAADECAVSIQDGNDASATIPWVSLTTAPVLETGLVPNGTAYFELQFMAPVFLSSGPARNAQTISVTITGTETP